MLNRVELSIKLVDFLVLLSLLLNRVELSIKLVDFLVLLSLLLNWVDFLFFSSVC